MRKNEMSGEMKEREKKKRMGVENRGHRALDPCRSDGSPEDPRYVGQTVSPRPKAAACPSP